MLSDKVDLKRIENIWNDFISKGLGASDYKQIDELNSVEKSILKLILNDLESRLDNDQDDY